VAHARHGRLDLVTDIAAELPGKLRLMLNSPSTAPTPYVVDYAVIAVLLIAVASTDGRELPRMIALAQRFHYLGGVQPTMTVAGVREMAEQADKVAALALLAALDRDSS
jgi:hypothetical protein